MDAAILALNVVSVAWGSILRLHASESPSLWQPDGHCDRCLPTRRPPRCQHAIPAVPVSHWETSAGCHRSSCGGGGQGRPGRCRQKAGCCASSGRGVVPAAASHQLAAADVCPGKPRCRRMCLLGTPRTLATRCQPSRSASAPTAGLAALPVHTPVQEHLQLDAGAGAATTPAASAGQLALLLGLQQAVFVVWQSHEAALAGVRGGWPANNASSSVDSMCSIPMARAESSRSHAPWPRCRWTRGPSRWRNPC